MTDQHEDKKKEKLELEEPGVAIPPDGGYGWVVLVAAFVGYFQNNNNLHF